MKNVKTISFPSETRSLKSENGLLWMALLVAAGIIAIQASAYERLKSRITPQAIYEACNSAKEAR